MQPIRKAGMKDPRASRLARLAKSLSSRDPASVNKVEDDSQTLIFGLHMHVHTQAETCTHTCNTHRETQKVGENNLNKFIVSLHGVLEIVKILKQK